MGKLDASLAIFNLKVTLIQVSTSVCAAYHILFFVAFVVTFCPVMKRALFEINLFHICSAGAFSPIAVVCVENAIRAADRFNVIIAYTWAGQRPPA